MNCQEAQSKIISFINEALNQEDTKAFIHHVRSCPNCWDELEINYILLVGMQQLDDGEILSADFQKELQESVNLRYQHIVREEEWQHGFQAALFAAVISFFLWILGECIKYFLQ